MSYLPIDIAIIIAGACFILGFLTCLIIYSRITNLVELEADHIREKSEHLNKMYHELLSRHIKSTIRIHAIQKSERALIKKIWGSETIDRNLEDVAKLFDVNKDQERQTITLNSYLSGRQYIGDTARPCSHRYATLDAFGHGTCDDCGVDLKYDPIMRNWMANSIIPERYGG